MLGEIFGAENDFDAILNGVNLAGVGANGRRVVQNLLEALTPILREGAERRLHATAMRPRLPRRPPVQPGARNDGLLVPADAGRAGRCGVCDTHRLPRYSGAAALAGRHG